jgi:hypothetical protein
MSFEEIPYCDTYYPTIEEFSNFEAYIEKITKSGQSGIVKVN